MPLTPFQRQVRLLAANRDEDSHVAGGAVLNRDDTALRYSEDLDIFHDAAERVAPAALADERTLLDAGYSVVWLSRTPFLCKATVGRGSERLRLDWTSDSAFRFFPILKDEDFGYCLHRADLATNKVLALAAREETRDFLDILQLDREYLNLGAIIWAACGKDPGFTPDLLLQMADRHSRYLQGDLDAENLAHPVDLRQLKRRWLAAVEQARLLFERLPPEEPGCLYLGPTHEPRTADPDSPEFPALIRHFGCLRGAWPQIAG